MAEMLTFELVSPERKLASVEAEAVTIPGALGDLTAMAHHAPFLTTLRPGYVDVTGGSEPARYFVTGGFAEISNNTVSVLAEEALDAGEVTREWLQEKITSAEAALSEHAPERLQAEHQQINDLRTVMEQAAQ
ncbi:ATP synthase F1 subunit epsilon [Rhodobacteraceae bacterium NNCM2]|nr:ATP synthase F1 subunit epsilon [Coraliihabitans acroporae]